VRPLSRVVHDAGGPDVRSALSAAHREHRRREREIQEDDLTTAFYENAEIDLGQLMREQFYLSLPMKPLCRDDCKGLCATCGTNWNTDACDCKHEWDDPRLDALRELRTKN